MTQHPFRALAPLAAAFAALAACQATAPTDRPSTPARATLDARAPAFVEAACGGCHAVEPPFLSPNPHAPSFAAIANRRNMAKDSLAAWLSDAHNYPQDMDFDLTPRQADDVAGYMIRLRNAGYVPD